MTEQQRTPVVHWRTGLRCAPFIAIILCFLLPFFTVQSCSDNQTATANPEATATGTDILLGTRLTAHPAEAAAQPPADVQGEAQATSRATRPWAILTVALAILGIVLMLHARKHHRLISAGISVAAFAAVVMMWKALDAPADGGTPDLGLLLISAVLLLSIAWQACVFAWMGLAYAMRPRAGPKG